MKASLGLMSCVLCLALTAESQPSITSKFQFRTHSAAGVNLPYRLFVPEGMVPGAKYPIVLALHGSGERGTDNRIQIEANRLATVWADPTNQASHPCFVVAPQCPQGDAWSTSDPFTPSAPASAALEMVDSLIREFPIDTSRQYITGLSMGGFGTWALIVNDPRRFAAAVPVCGGEDPAWASRLLEVPIWNFHGARDDVVPVEFSRSLVEALESQGRRAVYTHCRYLDCRGLPDSLVASAVGSREEFLYTEYADVAHNAWDPAYAEPLLIPWVFGFSRRATDAIRLTSLTSPAVISGDRTLTWTTAVPGDSAELWFSGDAGENWVKIAGPVPNTGSYQWETSSVEDCAVGLLRLVLLKPGRLNAGSSESAPFSIDNPGNGPPFVRILNPEFYQAPSFGQDSLDLRLFIADPEWGPVDVTISYDAGAGGPLEGVASFPATSDTVEQIRRIGLSGLANSNTGIMRVFVSDGTSVGFSSSSPFSKQTPRAGGPQAAHVEGDAGAEVRVNVVDQSALKGHDYRVQFTHTPPSTTVYDVIDVTASTTLLTGIGGLNGSAEGPAFDGVRLLVTDYPTATADLDSSRWVTGQASVTASIFVPSRNIGGVQYTGIAYPYDYLITLAGSVVDTSIAAFGLDAAPIKFSAFNLTLGTQADVGFFDGDGDGTISSLDEVDLLERDSLGNYRLSWAVFFVAEAGDTLPVPGDQFLVHTRKPLRSDDVYEFTTSVSSAGRAAMPTSFRLEQNYPNPFNGETVIRYEVGPSRAGVSGRSRVGLKVYDMLGREVVTLVEGPLAPGAYEARFAPGRLATGVYVYRLNVDGVLQSRKMIYLR